MYPSLQSAFTVPLQYLLPYAEYVHTVAHDDNESDEVRELANKTWHALKRTTKAGQRRSVSSTDAKDWINASGV
jgi:hypothetical protein